MPLLTKQHPPISTLLALDKAGNTLLWSRYDKELLGNGWGSPDETLSGRAGRLRYVSRFWALLAWCLDHIQAYHTSKAIDDDEVRAWQEFEAEQGAGEAQAEAVDEEIRKEMGRKDV